jgi:hypothetical protein
LKVKDLKPLVAALPTEKQPASSRKQDLIDSLVLARDSDRVVSLRPMVTTERPVLVPSDRGAEPWKAFKAEMEADLLRRNQLKEADALLKHKASLPDNLKKVVEEEKKKAMRAHAWDEYERKKVRSEMFEKCGVPEQSASDCENSVCCPE